MDQVKKDVTVEGKNEDGGAVTNLKDVAINGEPSEKKSKTNDHTLKSAGTEKKIVTYPNGVVCWGKRYTSSYEYYKDWLKVQAIRGFPTGEDEEKEEKGKKKTKTAGKRSRGGQKQPKKAQVPKRQNTSAGPKAKPDGLKKNDDNKDDDNDDDDLRIFFMSPNLMMKIKWPVEMDVGSEKKNTNERGEMGPGGQKPKQKSPEVEAEEESDSLEQ